MVPSVTLVYRKPTHNDRYLNYTSFHHPAIKFSVCRTLAHRAHSICDDKSIGKELDHIKDVLKNNDFPDKKIILNAPKPKSKITNNSTDLVKILQMDKRSYKWYFPRNIEKQNRHI